MTRLRLVAIMPDLDLTEAIEAGKEALRDSQALGYMTEWSRNLYAANAITAAAPLIEKAVLRAAADDAGRQVSWELGPSGDPRDWVGCFTHWLRQRAEAQVTATDPPASIGRTGANPTEVSDG